MLLPKKVLGQQYRISKNKNKEIVLLDYVDDKSLYVKLDNLIEDGLRVKIVFKENELREDSQINIRILSTSNGSSIFIRLFEAIYDIIDAIDKYKSNDIIGIMKKYKKAELQSIYTAYKSEVIKNSNENCVILNLEPVGEGDDNFGQFVMM